MPGEHARVRIAHADMWDSMQTWVQQQATESSLRTLQEFEHTCGLEFTRSMWRESVYVYRVHDAHRLMLSIARYGWRVTPVNTT